MIASIVATVLLCAATGLCVACVRRYVQGAFAAAMRSAKFSLLVSVAAAPAMFATAIVSAFFPNASESKAATLARGISISMNIGLFHVPVLLASSVVWALARRKRTAPKPTN